MKSVHHFWLLLLSVALLGFSTTSLRAEIESIVLNPGDEQIQLPSIAAQERYQRRSAAREKAVVALEKYRTDMGQLGYSIVDDSQLTQFDRFKEYPAPPKTLETANFAYVPIDVESSGSILSRAKLVAYNATHEEDGRIHAVDYVFQFKELGTVIVEELSYLTVPNTRITVSKPSGNLYVNGYPASYTALRNKSNDKGQTSIMFITDNKLFNLTVLKCVTRKDKKNFNRMLKIAQALH